MEAEIIERKDNPLLSREELVLKIRSNVTPSRKEVKDYVVASMNTDPKLTVVKKIWGKSGSHEFFAEIFIYKDDTVMKTVEPEFILKRNEVIKDDEAHSQ